MPVRVPQYVRNLTSGLRELRDRVFVFQRNSQIFKKMGSMDDLENYVFYSITLDNEYSTTF